MAIPARTTKPKLVDRQVRWDETYYVVLDTLNPPSLGIPLPSELIRTTAALVAAQLVAGADLGTD